MAMLATPPRLPPGIGPSLPPAVDRPSPIVVKAHLALEELVGEVGLGAGVVGVPRILYGAVVGLGVACRRGY